LPFGTSHVLSGGQICEIFLAAVNPRGCIATNFKMLGQIMKIENVRGQLATNPKNWGANCNSPLSTFILMQHFWFENK